MTTITKAMTDAAIASEVYARLEARRKSMSFTQEEMAEKVGITPKSYRALETGTCRLTTFIATLRHLDMLDNLDKMISPVGASPLEELMRKKPKAVWPEIRGRNSDLSESQIKARKSPAALTGGVKQAPSPHQENPILASRQKFVVKG